MHFITARNQLQHLVTAALKESSRKGPLPNDAWNPLPKGDPFAEPLKRAAEAEDPHDPHFGLMRPVVPDRLHRRPSAAALT